MTAIPENILKNRVFPSRVIAFNEQLPGTLGFGPDAREVAPIGAVVRENGDVALSMYAPEAKKVSVARLIDKAVFELTKDGNGLWSGIMAFETPGPKALDFYVDGVLVLNPYAPIYFGYSRPVNYVDIPDHDQDFFLIKEVPHGTVSHEVYYSAVTGDWETCVVYTPPGYGSSGAEYPVLYLQHGAGENENCWVWQGKVNFVADNLIAEGKTVPCVIVMNNGMVRPTEKGTGRGWDAFGDMLLYDCMPFIERKYRVRNDKWNRAMAGLSMGSMQTSKLTMSHPDKFGYIGLFSCFLRTLGASFEDCGYLKALDDLPQFEKEFRLLFRGWGDQDDFVQHILEDDQFLASKGASPEAFGIHKRIVYRGAHDWYVWRLCIHDFLPLLFRTDSK
jgi:enterochelin esterase-like enzyme